MMQRAFRAGLRLAATWVLLAAAGPAHADDDAQARFKAGTAAAAEGRHARALDAFRAALAAGLDGPAVHYNIGVSAWTIGDLVTAEQAFLAAAEYPAMAPLAHYNLGLVAQRRGDESAARRWFLLAREGSAGDPTLRQLAAAALDTLGPAPAPPRPGPQPGLTVFLAAHAGYDDNVALVADGELVGVSELSSAYGDLQFAALAPIGHNFSVQAGAFLLDYVDLPELDQAGAQIEFWYRPRIGTWRLDLGAAFALNQLDGERFEDLRRLSAGATRRVGSDWRLRWRVDYSDITGQAPLEGLSGDRLDARFQLRRYLDQQRWQVEYRFETNDRADPALSPDRHRIELQWRRALGSGLELEAGLGWRHGRYDTPDQSWTERRVIALLGLTGPVAGGWEWVVRFDYARNDGSIDDFDYSRNRGFAGVQASF